MTLITVEVRPLHRGRDIKVDIEKDNTVEDLKNNLQGGRLGWRGKYHLLFSQRKLENTKKLSEYNIQNGFFILLVLLDFLDFLCMIVTLRISGYQDIFLKIMKQVKFLKNIYTYLI